MSIGLYIGIGQCPNLSLEACWGPFVPWSDFCLCIVSLQDAHIRPNFTAIVDILKELDATGQVPKLDVGYFSSGSVYIWKDRRKLFHQCESIVCDHWFALTNSATRQDLFYLLQYQNLHFWYIPVCIDPILCTVWWSNKGTLVVLKMHQLWSGPSGQWDLIMWYLSTGARRMPMIFFS